MAPIKKKTIEETYTMLTQHEHILKRPDTYIGNVNKQISLEWVFDEQTSKIVKKNISYTPGFLKIVDEIITNAIDHSNRDSSVSKISVNIDKTSGEIIVRNDGSGIPVVIHSEHGIYVPEMIFSNLLTGSNYDDTEERNVAGRNGVGSTLAVIFSKKFKIETVDSNEKKKFSQIYTENMTVKSKPKITDFSGKSYTEVTFTPDYSKFEMECLDDDSYSILVKRVYECVACTNKRVSIYLNGSKIAGKGLIDYAKFLMDDKPIAHEIQGKWEYLVFQSSGYQQISFVNGNTTSQGGKHVDYILNQVTSGVKNLIETKKKVQNVKAGLIKDNIFILVNCSIPNPKFDSQTKDVLSTPYKDFGVSFDVSETFIKKIYSSPITQEVLDLVSFKDRKKMDKDIPVSKKSRMIVKNLEDATNAGTSKSSDCSLILTEGLSASSFAVSGLSVIGRANYGIFSLKGKLLNVREATQAQLLKNEEILNIKKIMGLHNSKTYKSDEEYASLRYGSITILADADYDGVHISGLVMNFIHHCWPDLLKRKGFIKTIRTPIVKVTKGQQVLKFYDETEYKKFLETKNGNWNSKYYKGLGTSTSTEAKETFKEMKTNLGIYLCDSDVDKSFQLAFDKKKADDRKKWLEHVPDTHASRDANNGIFYSDFINKELIYFSNYDNTRSIPHLMDGLKPSQRKVLYTAFKRNLTKEMKVAQFGAAVAEETAYHHGEVSLSSTIIGMAQNYAGTNNINLLEPCGNFGFRNHNGKDAASPRYIFTHLSSYSKDIFLKEDEAILEYNMDDGVKIEPKFYNPSLPMILINGTTGIGTGYSTFIPCFNPVEILENIKLILHHKEPNKLIPYYKGFKGTIKEDGNGYLMRGVFTKHGKIISITEIPINTSISEYKEFLESSEIFTVSNDSTENSPNFTLKFKNEKDMELVNHKSLKLEYKINLTNMHLFDEENMIKKYSDPNDIIRDFLKCKLKLLQKRKNHLIYECSRELLILENKKRFLEEIMDDSIVVYKKSKKEIEGLLQEKRYTKIDNSYNYLTSLQVSSFSMENLKDLDCKIKNVVNKKVVISFKSTVDLAIEDLNNLKDTCLL
jgi:DNA topoisomerase-2